MNPSVLSTSFCSAASVQVRGPGRFSDFALSGRKREPYASINGHEHQDSPALLAGGVLILSNVAVAFSIPAAVGAFFCALVTGVIFGFMPARKAARLDPVKALTSE